MPEDETGRDYMADVPRYMDPPTPEALARARAIIESAKQEDRLDIPDLRPEIIRGLRYQDPAAFKALERDEARLKARIWDIRTAIVEKAESLWKEGVPQAEA